MQLQLFFLDIMGSSAFTTVTGLNSNPFVSSMGLFRACGFHFPRFKEDECSQPAAELDLFNCRTYCTPSRAFGAESMSITSHILPRVTQRPLTFKNM